jgi:CheY-like chemotaxis protein
MVRWLLRKRTVLPSNKPAPRILIVDDQKSNVRLLEHTLRRAGYTEVRSTIEPREVVALHAQHHYDLILLDLQMPHMDGFAVLRALAEIRRTHSVAILVISADIGAMSAALSEGADAFMTKPFRLPDVLDHIGRVLEKAGQRAVEESPDVAKPKTAQA